MLTYSPEAAFFLALFEFVPSAFAFVALAWIRLWEKSDSEGQEALTAGILLLAAACGLQAVFFHVAVAPAGEVEVSLGWLLQTADTCRALSALLLGGALLRRSGASVRRRRVFLGPALALLALGLVRLPADQLAIVTSIDPLTTMRVATAGVLLLAAALLERSAWLASAALFVMALGVAGPAAGAFWPALTEWAWGNGAILRLAGLLLLAFSFESLSQRRLLHYVLRFNLTFLALAVSLIVALSEISRRQFVEFSVQQVQDVAELARGQMITAVARGQSASQFLDRPDVADTLIREFGRYPDLREVRLQLHGESMALVINDAGEIDQRFWTGPRLSLPPVAPVDFMDARLLTKPVVADGHAVGAIELFHSVIGLNARIGHQMWVAFGVFTLFVVVGSVVTGVLVLVADETIRQQHVALAEAQRRLLSSERLASVGAVADAVAHEVNNPAGVLIARSDYLLTIARGQPWAGEIQEDLDTIRRQAQRIAKTVQDLLSSTRRARHAREPVDVGAVVQSAITLVSPLNQGREIAFRNRVAPDTLTVWGDHGRIEQVFVNLLSNAAQAIPGRGTIEVTASVRPGGAWIDVEVADTGVGIHPDHMHRIFDRFFTTKEPGAGSGLGLSIVAAIVREHGGHIDVESRVGYGTRFRVTLRACVPGSEAAPAPEPGQAALRTPADGGTLDG